LLEHDPTLAKDTLTQGLTRGSQKAFAANSLAFLRIHAYLMLQRSKA
jgi:hypothetical protein